MAQRKRNPGAIRDLESIVNPSTGDITTTGNITVNNATVCGALSAEDSITLAGTQIRHPVQFGPFALASASSVSLVTDLPSWQNEVHITFVEMSTNGTAPPMIRLGTLTGLVTAGYEGSVVRFVDAAAVAATANSGGFRLSAAHSNTVAIHGRASLYRHGTPTSNIWEMDYVAGRGSGAGIIAGGYISLPGPLTSIVLTTTTGTATEVYDAGTAAGRYKY